MVVRELTLRDFRSYPKLELGLRPGVILVTGANGAGKTNLLDALHVGTQGVSLRTRREGDLVRFGESSCRVVVRGERERRDVRIEAVIHTAGFGHKDLRVDGAPVTSTDRLRAETAALAFTPDRLAVAKAGPSVRRRYLDLVLMRVQPARATLPGEYRAAVAQRNAALRRAAAGLSSLEAVAPWTQRVAAAGAELEAARREVIDLLSPLFTERAGELGLEQAALEYEECHVSQLLLEDRLSEDLRRGLTGLGPHLDEIRILAGGRDLRSFGSQGEQRTAVLALVLAEADILAARRGAPALLLLDDVLSELDGDRRRSLAERLRRHDQVVLTATSRSALPLEADQTLLVTPGAAREA